MKVKCENIVTCGNYKCAYNHFSKCIKNVVALDENGKCVLFKNKKKEDKTIQNPEPDPLEGSNAC
jgi:hypothetical protein